MDLVIGLDLGTSAVKGVLVSGRGEVFAQENQPVPLQYPKPGRVEFSAEEHYGAVCSVIRSLCGSVPAGAAVSAISMASASGSTVLLNKLGQVLGNTISWLDERAATESPDLPYPADAEEIYKVTGWRFAKSFPLAHLTWIKHREPEKFQKARWFVMDSTYALYRLTGRFGIDPSTATTSFLQNQVAMNWHEKFLDSLGVHAQSLPNIMPSGAMLGPVTAEACHETGLPQGAKVVLGAFDHPCAARGSGVFAPGKMLLSCGTSWVGFFPVGQRETGLNQKLLVDPFLSPEGPWGALFALTAIGAMVDACVTQLFPEQGRETMFATFNAAAARSAPGAGGLSLTVNAHAARRIGELRTQHDISDICRSLMEGVAFEVKKRMAAYAKAGMAAESIAMAGAPSQSPVWPQIIADTTGLRVSCGHKCFAGAFGAALIAATGAGLFKTVQEAYQAMKGEEKIIHPDPKAIQAYRRLYQEGAVT